MATPHWVTPLAHPSIFPSPSLSYKTPTKHKNLAPKNINYCIKHLSATSPLPSQMPATASGGARPEEAAAAAAASAPAASCMGTRPEELTARLAASGPAAPGAGRGGSGAGGEEAEHERVRALREIKNQIIGNRNKKLRYHRLAAVAALAEPGASLAMPAHILVEVLTVSALDYISLIYYHVDVSSY